MNDADAIAAGQQVRHALTVLDPAMDKVREAILAEMVKTSPEQTARILALHAAVQAVDATRKVITDVVANGELAEAAVNGAFRPS